MTVPGEPDMDELRRALAARLAYLRDLGVRDLRVGPAAPGGSGEAAGCARTPIPPRLLLPKERPGRPPRREPPASRELFAIPTADAGHPDPAAELRRIRERIGECTRCRLCEGRTNIVFGAGDPRARLMFVGEGPGADEDAQGEPFVGRAGQKLNEMIRAIGLRREEVYIANVVKCRPPGNRAPESDEVATCSPFLFAQIEAIRPKVIVALGGPAAQTLLGTRAGITQLRGKWGSFRGVPVIPTFHPAYLLRAYTQENRAKVWADLKAARARLDEGP